MGCVDRFAKAPEDSQHARKYTASATWRGTGFGIGLGDEYFMIRGIQTSIRGRSCGSSMRIGPMGASVAATLVGFEMLDSMASARLIRASTSLHHVTA